MDPISIYPSFSCYLLEQFYPVIFKFLFTLTCITSPNKFIIFVIEQMKIEITFVRFSAIVLRAGPSVYFWCKVQMFAVMKAYFLVKRDFY